LPRGPDLRQRPLARLLDLLDAARDLDPAVAADVQRRPGAVVGADHEPADEEGDDREEEEQAERTDIADPAAGEVLQRQVTGLRQQRPQRPGRARVPLEHAVEHVADDAREVAHQALHQLAAGMAVVAQQRGAAVGAGAAWRGRRRRRGGFGAGIHRSDRERGAATPGARPKIRPPPLAWRQRRRGRGPAAPPDPTMSPSATPARLGEEVRTTAALAAPLVAVHFASGLIGLVDSVIAGRHGTSTLAGVAVGTAMFWLVMLVPMGTLMALPPSVSQLDGAGRRAEVGPLFRQALWLALG